MIVGWKAIAKVSGFSLRTVKAWHYERLRIPFHKTSESPQGKVWILEQDFYDWLRSIKMQPARCRDDNTIAEK